MKTKVYQITLERIWGQKTVFSDTREHEFTPSAPNRGTLIDTQVGTRVIVSRMLEMSSGSLETLEEITKAVSSFEETASLLGYEYPVNLKGIPAKGLYVDVKTIEITDVYDPETFFVSVTTGMSGKRFEFSERNEMFVQFRKVEPSYTVFKFPLDSDEFSDYEFLKVIEL